MIAQTGGANGGSAMSPYEYAVAGGFTGTEDEFKAALGEGPWIPQFGVWNPALQQSENSLTSASICGRGCIVSGYWNRGYNTDNLNHRYHIQDTLIVGYQNNIGLFEGVNFTTYPDTGYPDESSNPCIQGSILTGCMNQFYIANSHAGNSQSGQGVSIFGCYNAVNGNGYSMQMKDESYSQPAPGLVWCDMIGGHSNTINGYGKSIVFGQNNGLYGGVNSEDVYIIGRENKCYTGEMNDYPRFLLGYNNILMSPRGYVTWGTIVMFGTNNSIAPPAYRKSDTNEVVNSPYYGDSTKDKYINWGTSTCYMLLGSDLQIITSPNYDGTILLGRKNNPDTTEGYLIVGVGNYSTAKNGLRVTSTDVYGLTYKSSGADYAEMFQWQDGNPDNEDRAGHFVTLDGEHIKLAGPEDKFVLGIISGNPSIVGDVHDDQWHGIDARDIFGRPIYEDVEVPEETEEVPDPQNSDQTITRVKVPAHTEHRVKTNPDYNPDEKYIPRSQRPEWATVGMMGKLVAVDDGTCQINGYAKVGIGGTATHSDEDTRYRVMARLDGTHIRVLIL